MRVDQKQIKEFLLDSGLVSKEDIRDAETKAKKDASIGIGGVLVEENKISADDLRRMQAYVMGVPFVSLADIQIDFEVLSLIPEPIARNHSIVSFRKDEEKRTLEVAMLDTDDLTAIDFVRKKVGLKILPRLTDDESMKKALLQYQKSLKAEFGDIIQSEALSVKTLNESEGEEVSKEDLKQLAEDVPVVRIVETLLRHAIIQNASDIHIEALETQVIIRYRIDGILRDAMTLPKKVAPSITARIKVLSNLKLDEKRLPQDGRFKIEVKDEKVSFRVSTLPTQYGEKIVMRLLRDNVSGFTLESVGFHGKALEDTHSALRNTTGMILTTGPTGSGKTTSLYTMLDMLNTPEVNISTIEDPVEYQMKRINQTQVKPEIGFTFTNGLRALVRQDPDVIMVGEIRDGETASLAVNASLTGHLVLSTLHTNSAAGAVPRLLDMGIEPFLLVSTLQVVMAQRLVRRLTDSKEKHFLTKSEIASLKEQVNLDKVLEALKAEDVVDKTATWEVIPFFKPHESEGRESYSGRLSIQEVLLVSSAVKELIAQSATADKIQAQAEAEGMLTMLEDGIFKAAQGITSLEEVLRVITE